MQHGERGCSWLVWLGHGWSCLHTQWQVGGPSPANMVILLETLSMMTAQGHRPIETAPAQLGITIAFCALCPELQHTLQPHLQDKSQLTVLHVSSIPTHAQALHPCQMRVSALSFYGPPFTGQPEGSYKSNSVCLLFRALPGVPSI